MDNNQDPFWEYLTRELKLPTRFEQYETMGDIIRAVLSAYFFGMADGAKQKKQ